MMKNYLKLLTFLSVLLLASCHQRDGDTSKVRIITVEEKPVTTALYYAGTIQPLKAIVVTSPADGVIENISFHYGDQVQPGQLLFTISSEKFQTDYKTALTTYLKAKNDFSNSESQMKEGLFLHKNELISDDDFKTRQTNFYSAQLAFLQAKDSLGSLLKQLDIKDVNLYDLTISDIGKIDAAMHLQAGIQKLKILAPSAGMILLPMSNDGGPDNKKLASGESVKQGALLALIAEDGSLRIHINVNEFDIGQLKLGLPVKITGSAFPEVVLHGKISGLDRQAQPNQSGIPTFAVDIDIPPLTAEQQKYIYIGMSAKVEVDIDDVAQILVPISAVHEKNGQAYVTKQGKWGRLSEQPVQTGKTTTDSIVILSNLKAGDKIAVPD
jgi:HlyD family secretion protein